MRVKTDGRYYFVLNETIKEKIDLKYRAQKQKRIFGAII